MLERAVNEQEFLKGLAKLVDKHGVMTSGGHRSIEVLNSMFTVRDISDGAVRVTLTTVNVNNAVTLKENE